MDDQIATGENAVTNPVTEPLPASVLEALARYDTPTICNAMEIVAPERRIGPSPAYVHADSFGGEVRVAGMTVRSGALIHADRHGASVTPLDVAAKLPDAAELCGRRETPILEIARSPSFSLEKLKAALARSSEIH